MRHASSDTESKQMFWRYVAVDVDEIESTSSKKYRTRLLDGLRNRMTERALE
jgi:hypothetical protein